ncbi:unnamed protein product [Allacma fusca]|uniref:Prolyl 4-hydroxylase N-terminal domain-containing protein n=1 Tax=Allacma fusca TaxID=39272 RepID=A0A8J2LIZ2_9HEXA|nr:unnamed protein product [Allacma fusca]
MEKSSFLCENDPREVFSLAESYLTYFEATTVKLQLNLRNEDEFVPYRANNVAWNSLSVYHMMKRFRSPLKEFVRALDPRNIDDYALQKQILHLMKFIGWPTEQDLQETMSSILRIQHTYDLGTADVSDLKLFNLSSVCFI